jgi:hypothetical protein
MFNMKRYGKGFDLEEEKSATEERKRMLGKNRSRAIITLACL